MLQFHVVDGPVALSPSPVELKVEAKVLVDSVPNPGEGRLAVCWA